MGYAERTEVSSDRSKAEIERTLSRYGASAFGYGWENERAIVTFRMNGKHIKFIITLPDRDEFKMTPKGRKRVQSQIDSEFERAVRQKWRALALVIKAKLEAIESGISCFEEEFLAHIVLPNGETVGSFMLPQVTDVYATGHMPKLLTM